MDVSTRTKHRTRRSSLLSGLRSTMPRLNRRTTTPKLLTEDHREEISQKLKPTRTGVHCWYLMIDQKTGRPYFRNEEKGQSNWGLPLRDIYLQRGAPSGYVPDDWQCYVDRKNLRRFYRSKQLNRIHYGIPREYRGVIGKLPFFSDEFALNSLKECMKEALEPEKIEAQTVSAILADVSVKDIIRNDTMCAAFHRFLVLNFAEENLLFIGAVELFKLGQWKGMKELGEESGLIPEDNEAQHSLQRQLKDSRSSRRIGFVPTGGSQLEDAIKIYNRFLAQDAELWVCTSSEVSQQVKARLAHSDARSSLTDLFDESTNEVYVNLAKELLPRFLRAVLRDKPVKGFEVDDLLQRCLLDVHEENHSDAIATLPQYD